MTRLIDPLIADLQVEYADAVQRGRRWKSRWLRFDAWTAFFKVLVICLWTDALAWHRWTSDDRRALIRSFVFSGVFIIAFTGLELLAVPMSLDRSSHSTALRLLLYLIPQALSITVTVGATFGILFGVGGRPFSGRVGASVAVLALVASAFSFVNMGWILPVANQAYRVESSGRADLPKGPPELTLVELSQAIDAGHQEPAQPPTWYFFHLKSLEMQYHNRWALSFSPLVLALFTLSLAAGGSLKRWMLLIAGCAAFLGYYILLYAGRSLVFDGTLPAYVSAWFPDAVFAVIAAFVTLHKFGASADHEPAR